MRHPSLYRGGVMHRRLRPRRYRFDYRLFHLLLDIDRIDETAAAITGFSHNRHNLIAFHDADHGPKDGSPLRPWIDARLAEAGVDLGGGQVLLLCLPRILGYAFNPLSVWYCYHADGRLRAVLCEVRNTFGEWHGYLLHDGGRALVTPVRDRALKCFYVSPFLPVEGEYRFRFSEPGAQLATVIQYWERDELTLVAAQTQRREALTARALWAAVAAMPLVTFKVIAAIHWQALKLWLRGLPLHRHRTPPGSEISA